MVDVIVIEQQIEVNGNTYILEYTCLLDPNTIKYLCFIKTQSGFVLASATGNSPEDCQQKASENLIKLFA